MPLLFSYGTLQDETVQMATFGRFLQGHTDTLIGFEQMLIDIDDPKYAATSWKTHYTIVRYNGRSDNRVKGMVFELTDTELTKCDEYEPAGYKRIMATLASGKNAWVYADHRNIRQAVPFFGVTDIEASLRFYVEGLGFTLTNKWTPEGRIRWCWLERDDAALMLQEYWKDGKPNRGPAGPLGQGVSICFMCADAIRIYHEAKAKGLAPQRPYVGNGLWVTSFVDPDGYRLDFESLTDVPEETVYPGP